MKISGLRAWALQIPYRTPIQWGGGAADASQYVVLKLETDDGVDGWAEAPQLIRLGKSAAVLARTLCDVYEPFLIGLDPLAPERVWARIGRLQGDPRARALIATALCDIQARYAGLPCWKYLGGWTGEVPIAWLVNRAPPADMVKDAEAAVKQYGFRALKVKIGVNAAQDVEVVRRLRSTFGDDMFIWVDANSGFGPAEALKVSEQLAELGVRLFEDPCPLTLAPHTGQFFARSAVPVMVDRGADSAQDVETWIKLGAPAVGLKVLSEGYRNAAKVVAMAERYGVQCIIGVSEETGLGGVISHHFRGAFRHLDSVPAENCFFLKLQEDILEEPIAIEDGIVKLSERPGLGVTLSSKALDRLAIAG